MNIFNIRYAKLNLRYDKNALIEDIDRYRDIQVPQPSHTANWSKAPFEICNLETRKRVTVFDGKEIQYKEIPQWNGVTYTQIKGNIYSQIASVPSRNNNQVGWTWREDLEIPHIKALVESLNFSELHLVMSMRIDKGGLGLVHNDDPRGVYYGRNDCLGITINLKSGGTKLYYRHNGNILTINDDCCIFRDDCWHGVPPVSSERLLLRINGKPNEETIESLVDTSSIIWI